MKLNWIELKVLCPNIIQEQPSSNVQKRTSRGVVKKGTVVL